MPPRGLPGNANLEQLKKGAKSFQRAVRAGDAGAAQVVSEFHPRLAAAQPGSAELNGFTRADAQLVVARQFGFASWPRLKAHLELVARYARSPHHEPVGGPLTDEQAVVDEFLRLACLNYGDDDPDRFRRAASLLQVHEWLARGSIHTIAATGEVDAARELLNRDPSHASLLGGPFGWEPLLYLTYSRAPLRPGRSGVGVARLLLTHGVDPNAGYLWEGLIPPFTALTGALGGGGTIPKHPEELALARLLLQAGADANDGQALYNQGWGPSAGEEWLELLFEFGLGTGDGGPWRRRFGERQDSPRKMVEDLLIAAASHGFTDRVRGLLARGVDPEGREIKHPIYRGRSPVQEAALNGHMDIVALLVDAGATWEHDQVDELIATAMSGDRDATERLLATDAGLRERAIERCPDQLVIRDTGYKATPAGWAEHHEQPAAQRLLKAVEKPLPPIQAQDGAVPPAQPGAAMRTVTAAFTAISEGRFDDLGSMLAPEIDWQGLPDEDGQIPRCAGREEALERMRIGMLANDKVSVSAFVEEGDRVLAHVHQVGDDETSPPERFLVAEVHDGQITNLRGYATEPEAQEALHASPSADAPPDSDPGPSPRAPHATSDSR